MACPLQNVLFGLTITDANDGNPSTVPNTAFVTDFDFK